MNRTVKLKKKNPINVGSLFRLKIQFSTDHSDVALMHRFIIVTRRGDDDVIIQWVLNEFDKNRHCSSLRAFYRFVFTRQCH